ncbi:MAG: HAD family hydrolase [Halanaerobiales bacterium]|nr:HAD family hydrolase [Halanaerobiales bacterium]
MENKGTILFDLDGTLLPMDMDNFIEKYFEQLSKHFSDLFDPQNFVKAVNKATENMIKNNGNKTNQEVFTEKFFELISLEKTNKEEIWNRFDSFYDSIFPGLQKYFDIDKKGKEIVEKAKEKGFDMVIATNPLFPRNAITARLEWIDLDPDDFTYITSYEDMHYCKPNPGYYQEILEVIECESQNCVMVGNDERDDMVAKKLGIKTFLIEDFKVERKDIDIKPDWQGTRDDIIDYLDNLEVNK